MNVYSKFCFDIIYDKFDLKWSVDKNMLLIGVEFILCWILYEIFSKFFLFIDVFI